MGTRFCALYLGLSLLAMLRAPCTDNTYVRFTTNLGNIDVQLFSDEAPNTVANFLAYVNSGAYTNSIIHRSATTVINMAVVPFVIQGGGYYLPGDVFPLTPITPNAAVASEAGVSNTRGTIAMALSTGPNSGTNEWFFNLGNNSAALDGTADGGPFTVFGRIANTSSLSVMDQISNLQVYDGSQLFDQNFTNLPLINYNSTIGLQVQNFVTIFSIAPLTVQNFAAWQSTNFVGQPSNVSAPTATPLNDGVPNLLKYLYGINPTVPMTVTDRAKLPTVGTTMIGGTQYLTLTYHQYTALAGVTVNVQTSPDLKTWTAATNPTIVQTGTDSGGDPIMQVQVPATGTKQFIRLNVTQP